MVVVEGAKCPAPCKKGGEIVREGECPGEWEIYPGGMSRVKFG